MNAKRRLESACARAQSDQGVRCSCEEALGPRLPIERQAKTWRLRGLHMWSCRSCRAQVQLWKLNVLSHGRDVITRYDNAINGPEDHWSCIAHLSADDMLIGRLWHSLGMLNSPF